MSSCDHSFNIPMLHLPRLSSVLDLLPQDTVVSALLSGINICSQLRLMFGWVHLPTTIFISVHCGPLIDLVLSTNLSSHTFLPFEAHSNFPVDCSTSALRCSPYVFGDMDHTRSDKRTEFMVCYAISNVYIVKKGFFQELLVRLALHLFLKIFVTCFFLLMRMYPLDWRRGGHD